MSAASSYAAHVTFQVPTFMWAAVAKVDKSALAWHDFKLLFGMILKVHCVWLGMQQVAGGLAV